MPVSVAITPTQADAQTWVRAFLEDILPQGTIVIAAMPNRVPEPRETDFVIISPMRFVRSETNLSTYHDCKFTASIGGDQMAVTDIDFGEIAIGATVFGTGVLDGTRITDGPDDGGVGTYTVSKTQTLASGDLSAGRRAIELRSLLTVQLDFHSGNDYQANQNAQTASTLLRDPYGYDFITELSAGRVAPLHADDSALRPFTQDQNQWEQRWVSEATFQVNQTLMVPAQFADSLSVDVISVDAEWPPDA